MSLELEVALLGILFGAILMAVLFAVTGRALDHLKHRHGIDAGESTAGE